MRHYFTIFKDKVSDVPEFDVPNISIFVCNNDKIKLLKLLNSSF